MGRPRFDLDGIALHADSDTSMVLAILRRRTTAGLELLMPESGNFDVPWDAIEDAHVDLAAGQVTITFSDSYAQNENWLRGESQLIGRWLDRLELSPVG